MTNVLIVDSSRQVNEQKALRQEHTDSTLKLEQLSHQIDSINSSSKNAARQVKHHTNLYYHV